MNNREFLIQVCRGLIRHPRARRTLMFYCVLFAIILVFSGATVFWPLLRNHPFLFLGYWAICVWITIFACLLAVYDMAKVREEGRRERARLRAEYLESLKLPQVSGSEKPGNPPDESE